VIPELSRLIGDQPAVPELSGTALQNRFDAAFRRFIRVFTRPEHPLVIFLDDLQWADPVSLKLIQLLVSDRRTRCLLLIGAYRDSDVPPAHPLNQALAALAESGAAVSTIRLAHSRRPTPTS